LSVPPPACTLPRLPLVRRPPRSTLLPYTTLFRSFAAYSASRSLRCALSRSTIAVSAAVPSVIHTGPANPSRTSTGRYPEWSRWQWVRTTSSTLAGSTANGSQLRRRHSRSPWYSPQSTRRRPPGPSSRNFDPVTVSAPPRKLSTTGSPNAPASRLTQRTRLPRRRRRSPAHDVVVHQLLQPRHPEEEQHPAAADGQDERRPPRGGLSRPARGHPEDRGRDQPDQRGEHRDRLPPRVPTE